MNSTKQQEIALLRYAAIAPLVAGLDEKYPSKDAFFVEAASKGFTFPDGSVRHFSPATIENWYYSYIRYGFDSLVPKHRSDAGTSRKLDDELK